VVVDKGPFETFELTFVLHKTKIWGCNQNHGFDNIGIVSCREQSGFSLKGSRFRLNSGKRKISTRESGGLRL
jgi:hypothetical protein